jgi:recombinational DNA repair protein RecT
MTKDEVDSIKQRSRAGSSGPWVTDYNEMGKKTVFRRLTKWIPLSAEIRDAYERDADGLDVAQEPLRKVVLGRVDLPAIEGPAE